MISWLVSPPPDCAKFAARMPLVRGEPLMARRSTLLSPGLSLQETCISLASPSLTTYSLPLKLQITAPGSPPASSASDVVSVIDSDEPKPDSTIHWSRLWYANTPAGAVNSFRPTWKEAGFSNSNSFAERVPA